MKKVRLFIAVMLLIATGVQANNLVIGTPQLSGSTVSFTIKWDNSWRVTTGPSNWDAVWVFVKRQTCNQATANPWVHADLAASGHSITGSQLQVDLASDNKGVFISRSAAGVGNINQATLTLTLASAIGGDNIGVFGIEMVNVPQGEFYVGDGAANAGQNGWNFTDGNSDNPLLITQAIQQNGIGLQSNYQRNNVGASNTALGATFPYGYNRFYCMKYEITSSQYVAFLNTLTYNQQLRMVRDPNQTPPESPQGTVINNTYNGYRIEIKTPGESVSTLTPAVFGNDATDDNNYDQPDDGLGIAVGLGTKEFLSYLDWAALRPMTEFEYEKACRGPLNPVPWEYSWGTNDYRAFNNYNINNRFTANETLSGTGLGMGNVGTNVNYRVGIAATATSNRLNAGATYYGIMEMTGGQYERTVGRHDNDCSIFTGLHGDGNLTSDAFSNVTGWGEQIIGSRGGSWRRWEGAWTSGRYFSIAGVPGGTYHEDTWADFGGRGVRSY